MALTTLSTEPAPLDKRALLALIAGQICLHSCMTGIRVAAPLLVLHQGGSAGGVGLLLGLFAAAPVAMSLRAGRMADRHGYHRPMRLAVLLTTIGGLAAVASTWLGESSAIASPRFALLCLAATLCGIGANIGLIAIQRTAGRLAAAAAGAATSAGHGSTSTELTRVFSWLGLAPALANMVGPVAAGTMIDAAGFRGAFIALLALPLAGLWWARRVPVERQAVQPARAPGHTAWSLFASPGLKRLLAVNWLLSSSWDLHAFVVPVLGHERGFSASAIGLILGVFAACVAAVRLLIPMLAHRLREAQVLAGAMLMAGAVFAVYPLAHSPLLMSAFAALLGVALGSVQPMIMTTLHQLTPPHRHGEAIALRSMTINTSSAVMPLLFGAAGAALGAGVLFWVMGLAVAGGSLLARRIGRVG